MYGSVTNIGYNPTFGKGQLVAETHIFNCNKDIYGQSIRLNLLCYLRGEVKFDSIAELYAQIHKDLHTAKQVLADAAKERLRS